MDETFGARLRAHRERQQVPLASIAEQTKIKTSMFEGLERDDVSHWPEGIFRRAYVRAYAQAVGLDPDPLVREFLALHPDSVDMLSAISAVAEPSAARPKASVRSLLASAVSALPGVGSKAAERGASDDVTPAVVEPSPVVIRDVARPAPDLSVVARLCTGLGQVADAPSLVPLLADASRMLDAVGLIVWSWEPRASALRPSLAHGYSDAVLAQFPHVPSTADNAIAAAFRSAETRIVHGNGGATGAVVVPLLAPAGCVGVLAVELRQGGEARESIRSVITILAAQLTNLVASAPLADAVNA